MTRTLLTGLAAALFASGHAVAAPQTATVPHGVFALAPLDAAPAAALYGDPAVVGVTFTSRWSALEPAQGQFDWAALDARVAAAAAAGRQVALSVTPGVFSPDWLYAHGAARFSFKWTLPWGLTPCAIASFPLPWDRVYAAEWTAFVAAFGQHYAGNPAVTVVKITGINGATPELLLPFSVLGKPAPQEDVTCGNTPVAPLSTWKAAGYRPSKITAAWVGFVGAFAHSFPNQQLMVQTGPWGLPPITEGGEVVPGSKGDTTLVRDLLLDGMLAVGSNYALENDGLRDMWHWQRPSGVPASVPVAYQTAARVTDDETCRMHGFLAPCDPLAVMRGTIAHANAGGAEFLELYRADLLNPALSSVITGFRK